MRKKKRICFFTGSRSEYGLIRDLLRKIEKDKIFALYLSVIGSHFSKEHGNTKKEILKDKFKNISFLKTKIYDGRADLTLSLGTLSKKVSKRFSSDSATISINSSYNVDNFDSQSPSGDLVV